MCVGHKETAIPKARYLSATLLSQLQPRLSPPLADIIPINHKFDYL